MTRPLEYNNKRYLKIDDFKTSNFKIRLSVNCIDKRVQDKVDCKDRREFI